MKNLIKRILKVRRQQTGAGFADVLVALALLGILMVTLFSALGTSSKTAAKTDEMVNMNNLARAQMEYTKIAAYISGSPDVTTYPLVSTQGSDAISVPAGYTISVVGHALNQPDDGIQEVTVAIHRGSDTMTLKGYKVNR